jgi:hypothetical protein
MELLRLIGKFIAWLTGSLAGIAAVLYACGYLVTRAHLNFLGLYGLFEYSNEHFIQEGGKFLLALTHEGARRALSLLVTSGLLWLGLLVLISGVLKLVPAFSGLVDKGKIWLSRLQGSTFLRRLLYSFLLFLLILHSEKYHESFTSPLMVSNLLYQTAAPSLTATDQEKEVAKITSWLLNGDAESAYTNFRDLLWADVLAAGLLVLGWRSTWGWRLHVLATAPFLISFLIYTISLPMAYGVLVRPTKYPVIVLTPGQDPLPSSQGILFLLKKTDHEFVVWDSGRRVVLWIPKNSVTRAEVTSVGGLFGKRAGER